MQPEWTHCKELPVQQQREHRKSEKTNMAELEGVALISSTINQSNECMVYWLSNHKAHDKQ